MLLSSLGGTLEFYDFVIFVFFAEVISKLFYPSDIGYFWSSFNTYATFAVGYFIRPLGGIVMAHFGDKNGRKNMFMLSILLMVIPTFLMGILPTYESIGYFAPVILLLIRIFQGIAIGGELPGAWVFVCEHTPKNRLGFSIGVLTSSITGGILLGSIASLIVNLKYGDAEVLDYAWRIPFILGGIFGIISVFLRTFLEETPIFQEMKTSQKLLKIPLKEVFLNSKKAIFISGLMTWVLTGCIVILVLLMPNFIYNILNKTYRPITHAQIILIQMGIICTLGIGCLLSGFLRDRFGTVSILKFFSLSFIISSLIFFYVLTSEYSIQTIVIWYLISGLFAGMVNFTPLIMVNIFPANVRFSGLSFSYNIAYAIFGGLAPVLMATIGMYDLMFIGYYLAFLGFISFSVSIYLKSKKFE
ncbi:MFS transporter [Helicobacter cappadocius]|uniref:MFS transporter n=1 Tax=Helicobacter cappadocius TaxID=3063998 RepID=A0AA90PLI7_9HELI|nr:MULTISPECIES: MFS transporter [unclassified Helicobacter]MDO7253452.1 MFS transporter [Helicobacter sp. faydin-H75]MDP2539379.1 MFS transporter [Helicobacter sp. faydin-H76]